MRKLAITTALLTGILLSAFGQMEETQPSIFLKKISVPPTIDGKLSEDSWFTGRPARDFWQYFPTDSTQAAPKLQTEIYMAYDENHLYIGAICHSPGQDYVTPSLRRDYRAGGNDNITFLLDPFRDRTNAFVFGMNPFGVKREALISNGGNASDSWNGAWDNKWRGESQIFDGYWSCELAIPFSTLRFKEGEQEWYFNSYRFDTQTNSRFSWNRIPQNQIIMSLAYMSPMVWEEPLQKTGSNISVIPYLTGNYQQTFLEEIDEAVTRTGEAPDYGFGAGGDVKLALTPGLNLDLTVNPDFSQVEVDEQQLDLSRFELFFPERRQFFLENADLFGNFGNQRINPFFSRRIGIGEDTLTEERIAIPILGGARLSGKLDNNWRLGLLNMQTEGGGRTGPAYNYSVASVQRRIFSRSYLGAIFVNKQSFGNVPVDTSSTFSPYNRVLGLEYNLASSDNVWNGKAFYQHSFSPIQGEKPYAHGASLEYRVRRFRAEWQHQLVGEDFEAEVGFVPRTNFFSESPEIQFYFYPNKGRISQHGPGFNADVLWQPGFGKADHEYEIFWDAELRNTADLRLILTNEETFLFEEFDPSKSDALPLPDSAAYNYTYFRAFYSSDRSRKLAYSIQPVAGQFFNGQRYGLSGSLTYRYQPFGAIEMNFNYTHINLPAPYATTNLILVGPRIDLTFTKSLFLTAFVQFNNQAKNVNINTRLQWRFAPVSDFFLVYTDNYWTESGLAVRNRAIVAKATYWLNI